MKDPISYWYFLKLGNYPNTMLLIHIVHTLLPCLLTYLLPYLLYLLTFRYLLTYLPAYLLACFHACMHPHIHTYYIHTWAYYTFYFGRVDDKIGLSLALFKHNQAVHS